ncbi:MAG: A/G-specific adenine glycosylase [Phycisphaerales bacterium]
MPRGSAARDARLAAAITSWFKTNARPFPWRPSKGKRDPYVALVSEVMLQQTQAARVAERLPGFLERFPTVLALAEASEDDVLSAWTGLGYYRRARTLHACAKVIVASHDGRVPRSAEGLRTLPGIGPYSAGSLASIVFGQREPIVDANVARVLLRIEGVEASPKEPGVVRWLWERADDLVGRAERPGVFNEGMMELGALICMPRSARCGACPVAKSCRARRNETVDTIPLAAPGGKKRTIHHAAVIVRDSAGRVLMERRADKGLWAAHWQAVAVEQNTGEPSAAEIRAALGVRGLKRMGEHTRVTSAARVEIVVYSASGADGRRGEWIAPQQLSAMPVAGPHRSLLGLSESTVRASAT